MYAAWLEYMNWFHLPIETWGAMGHIARMIVVWP